MTNTITNRQMFFILVLTLTSYSVIAVAKEMAETAGRGAWLTLIATAVVFAVGAAVIVRLNNKFKNQMVFDYAQSLVGRPVAYMMGLFYTLYFMFILVFLVTETSMLLNADFFPSSPLWSFPLFSLPLYGYIAHKGVSNVARLAEIIGAAFIVTAVFVHILMITEGDIDNILPLFNAQDIGRYAEAVKYSVFTFLGIEMLLVLPIADRYRKKSSRTAVLALLAVGLLYVFIVESIYMKLGLEHTAQHNDALIAAIRGTAPAVLEIIARLDILYLTVGFAGQFLGSSLVMLAVTEFVCRMLPRLSRRIVVITIVVLTYGFFLYTSGLQNYTDFAESLGSILGLIGAFAIPLGLLIITKVKKQNSGQVKTDAR